MDYRLSITMSDYGREPSNGERFLDAFDATHPEVGGVVSQNVATGTLTLTLTVDATDADDAYQRAQPIVAAVGAASGLPPTRPIALEVEAVAELAAELQPA